jgi:hypothetical protein
VKQNKLQRYIKSQGTKVEMKTTSINLETTQYNFVKLKNINLSKILRDFIQELMDEDKDDL